MSQSQVESQLSKALTAALQELKDVRYKNEVLEQRNAKLQDRVTELEDELNKLLG